MRLLVSGDRDWAIRTVVYEPMSKLPIYTVVIHGAARGLDTIAAECALELGLTIDKPPTISNPLGGYPADWSIGRRAGPIRNQKMIDEGHPDELWAWHGNIMSSNGTKDMVMRSLKSHIPTYVFTEDGCKHIAKLHHKDIWLQFDQLGLLANHDPETHFGIAMADVDTASEVRHLEQMMLLPKHTGTCDCQECNEVYGVRKNK